MESGTQSETGGGAGMRKTPYQKFRDWPFKTPLFVLSVPVLMLWLPIAFPGKASLTGFVMVVMGAYWVTEVLPLAVTALLPVVLLPIFGIVTVDEVCANYMKDLMMLFIGGLMVAISIEKCNLHRRIALGILRLIGGDPKWLMLGFMVPTWFLSMWISNTATTAMMLPIANAVLVQLEENAERDDISLKDVSSSKTTSDGYDNLALHTGDEISDKLEGDTGLKKEDTNGNLQGDQHATSSRSRKEEREVLARLSKGLTICVAYAANVGGTGTLTGTGPNVVMKGFSDDIWKQHNLPPPVSFASWMIFGFPGSVILLVVVWFWLQIFYLRSRAFCWSMPQENKESTKKIILEEYKKLGRMSFAEGMVLFMFILLVILWFFREPQFMPGWGDLFQHGYTDDATPAIAIAAMLFFIPQRPPACFRKHATDEALASTGMLLDWKTVQHKLPWGLVLLIGGGFAIAQAATKSGLSLWIANQLDILEALPDWLMIMVLCLMVALLTEFTSNTATCTLLMPIVAIMAENSGKNPLYLMFPVAVSTSFAFMLPVATPPNAIAFATGRITVIDMVKSGAILNVLCVLVVALATQTWGMSYFKLDQIPWNVNASSTF